MKYPDRLQTLRLPSLVYRRARGDMIETYKYLHNVYDVNNEWLRRDPSTRTRGHSMKLEKRRCSSTMRQHCFSNRVIKNWNSLPESVISSPSVNRGSALCSPVPMFPGTYVRRTYVPRYLCSPRPRYLCSPVPMFPEPMFPGTYMFHGTYVPRTYVPRYLCSPSYCKCVVGHIIIRKPSDRHLNCRAAKRNISPNIKHNAKRNK